MVLGGSTLILDITAACRPLRCLFVSGGPKLGGGPLQMAIELCPDGDLLGLLQVDQLP